MELIFRAFGVLAVLGAIALAVLGDLRAAAAAGLVAIGSFLSSPRASLGEQNRGWLALVVVCGGIALLVGSWAVGLVLTAAVVALRTVATWSALRVVRRAAFEPAARGEVMAGAERLVAEFESAGFEQAGGHRIQLGSRRIVVTVLSNPENDRMAFATDRVWQVVSRYGDRWLVTSNSGLAPLPPNILRQHLDRGRPAALVLAHERAVGMLRTRGLEPDRFDGDAEVLQAARELERQAIAFMNRPAARKAMMIEMSSESGPLLEDDSRSPVRIDRWMHAASAALDSASS